MTMDRIAGAGVDRSGRERWMGMADSSSELAAKFAVRVVRDGADEPMTEADERAWGALAELARARLAAFREGAGDGRDPAYWDLATAAAARHGGKPSEWDSLAKLLLGVDNCDREPMPTPGQLEQSIASPRADILFGLRAMRSPEFPPGSSAVAAALYRAESRAAWLEERQTRTAGIFDPEEIRMWVEERYGASCVPSPEVAEQIARAAAESLDGSSLLRDVMVEQAMLKVDEWLDTGVVSHGTAFLVRVETCLEPNHTDVR